MDKDEALVFMVENGLLSIPWFLPQEHKTPAKKTAPHKKKIDDRIVAYHLGELSEHNLCNDLGIKENELFRYLVDNGALFYFE